MTIGPPRIADPEGHDSRSDVFTLTVDRTARTPATLGETSPVEADVLTYDVEV